MEYEIVATLGPSSDQPPAWEALLEAGAGAFRLNTSHLNLDQLHAWLERLYRFRSAAGLEFPVILDLQGSKWRLGDFAPFKLAPEAEVVLILAATSRQAHTLPVPHADFFQAAAASDGEIVLNDARQRLRLESRGTDWLKARVIQGGEISAHKGLTLPASTYRKESLNEKDRTIFELGRPLGFVRFALSYVKDAQEMAAYRGQCEAGTYLIAKLERQPAIDEAERIAVFCNELWLCRGDLGAELGLPAMARAVSSFSDLIPGLPVPALMAGQVLEHMSEQAVPTRSEVCYLYDCLVRGYRGVVLSDETATGRFPFESCRVAAMFKG